MRHIVAESWKIMAAGENCGHHSRKAEIISFSIGQQRAEVTMKLQSLIKSLACFLVLMAPLVANAHTALKESTPGDGATITAAPGHIDLVFNGPVRLIKLDLKAPDHEMPTNFHVSAEAIATYRVETPNMHPGQFTVEWAAIGADGHTVTNTFSFVVDPGASSSSN